MFGLVFEPQTTATSNNKVTGLGSNWFGKILDAVVKVTDIKANRDIGVASAGQQPIYTDTTGYYPPILQRNPANNNQVISGQQVGAVTGNFLDSAMNFASRNIIPIGLIGGAVLLYKMQPTRRNGNRVALRNGATKRRRRRAR